MSSPNVVLSATSHQLHGKSNTDTKHAEHMRTERTLLNPGRHVSAAADLQRSIIAGMLSRQDAPHEILGTWASGCRRTCS
jgi:hypothetical protein